mgnify:CR=1 FL=1
MAAGFFFLFFFVVTVSRCLLACSKPNTQEKGGYGWWVHTEKLQIATKNGCLPKNRLEKNDRKWVHTGAYQKIDETNRPKMQGLELAK